MCLDWLDKFFFCLRAETILQHLLIFLSPKHLYVRSSTRQTRWRFACSALHGIDVNQCEMYSDVQMMRFKCLTVCKIGFQLFKVCLFVSFSFVLNAFDWYVLNTCSFQNQMAKQNKNSASRLTLLQAVDAVILIM